MNQSQRDTLAALLLEVITSPNQGAASVAKSCATIAMSFAWLDGADDRLAAKHAAHRGQALTRALAQALQIVEQISVDLAVDIVSELESDVRPLDGEPVRLDCSPIVIRPLIAFEEGTIAVETVTRFLKEKRAR
jgi:hypothetical protein